MWEEHYIPEQVLRSVSVARDEVTVPRDGRLPAQLPDCAVVVLRNRQSNEREKAANKAAVAAYAKGRCRFAVALVGEEQFGCDCEECIDPTILALSPLVLRQFFDGSCAKYRQLVTIPLGVKASAADWPISADVDARRSRTLGVFFATGGWREERTALVKAFRTAAAEASASASPPSLLLYPDAGHSGEDPDYAAHMCDAYFALCPRGNVEDTWRLIEALRCGAIPVVTDGGQYFHKYMPVALTSTFVTVASDLNSESLQAAVAQVHEALANQSLLSEWSNRVRERFRAWDAEWQGRVATMLRDIT
jgi:hypothetical protein